MISEADDDQFSREVLLNLVYISEDSSYETLSSTFKVIYLILPIFRTYHSTFLL
jgi:hypothetical protein